MSKKDRAIQTRNVLAYSFTIFISELNIRKRKKKVNALFHSVAIHKICKHKKYWSKTDNLVEKIKLLLGINTLMSQEFFH